jgi:hypothetical protein
MGERNDWFSELDAELQKQTEAISKDLAEMNNQKRMLNKTLIEDFWKIYMRFGRINVNMTMEPSHEAFASFEVYPDVWNFKDGFNFAAVNSLQLVDRTTEQGRMGDSLKVWYYSVDTIPHIRMVFEYCEGEHYYKYAGWKRSSTSGWAAWSRSGTRAISAETATSSFAISKRSSSGARRSPSKRPAPSLVALEYSFPGGTFDHLWYHAFKWHSD